MDILGPLLIAFVAYIVGTASPGPATLTIMMTAASKGRVPALQLAAGIILGSVVWGIVATLGVSIMLAEIAFFLYVLKFVGGAYLLWLAYQSVRAAMRTEADMIASPAEARYFVKGFLLHLTNPKAVLVWGSILTIGVTAQSPFWVAPLILVVCSLLGAIVFTVYALVFSTSRAMKAYSRARRPVQAACATLFGAAGLNLVFSRS